MTETIRSLVAAMGTVLIATVWPGSLAAPEGYLGQTHVVPVERTDRGVWDGTWFYTNRDFRMVLWLRTDQGAPTAKLQFLSTTVPPESFATDWRGEASYTLQKGVGKFLFELTDKDANTIRGNWNWDLDLGDSSRIELGRFTIYRGGDGRLLVVKFEDFERIHRRGEDYEHYPSQHVMTFRKISKRQVLWDEIPF
jgi:hypothetical protein